MSDIEISIVNNLFTAPARERAVRLLTSKRGRSSFVHELRHFDYFNKNIQPISLNERNLVESALQKHATSEKVYVISVYEEFDRCWINLDAALDELFGFLGGTIISSADCMCIFYEGEDPKSRCLLEMKIA